MDASGSYVAPGTVGSFQRRGTSAADSSVSAAATITVSTAITPPGPTTRPVRYIGGHLPEISGWTAPTYADAIKQGRRLAAAGTLNTLGASQFDVNGNPTVDCRSLFIESSGAGPSAVVAGTYKLFFRPGQRLRRGLRHGHESRLRRSTNATTADVNIPSSGGNSYIDITNSWRNAAHTADATGNSRGVTNLRLMYPGHSYPTDYWRKEVVALNRVFSLMRFEWALGGTTGLHAGLTGIMGSTETSWSTRQYPGVPGYQDFGTPWEDTVIFANTTGMDVWVNIPIGADNDYVTKVFQLLKYGSNGRDPYTVQTHDPATWQQGVGWYPGLLPGRKVYVEFTNELFSYYSYGDPQGAADIADGDKHHLAYDGSTSTPGDKWGAWNVVRISLLARKVWGDAAMQDTIRIVYAEPGRLGRVGAPPDGAELHDGRVGAELDVRHHRRVHQPEAAGQLLHPQRVRELLPARPDGWKRRPRRDVGGKRRDAGRSSRRLRLPPRPEGAALLHRVGPALRELHLRAPAGRRGHGGTLRHQVLVLRVGHRDLPGRAPSPPRGPTRR